MKPFLRSSPPIGMIVAITGLFSSLAWAQIQLGWDESPSTNVVGYRLYQGIASHTYTNFYTVGKTNGYTVPNLVRGQIYYFSATAVDTNWQESAFSNEVVGTNWPYISHVGWRARPGYNTNGIGFNIRECRDTNNLNQLSWVLIASTTNTCVDFLTDPNTWKSVTMTNSITGQEWVDGSVCPIEQRIQ